MDKHVGRTKLYLKIFLFLALELSVYLFSETSCLDTSTFTRNRSKFSHKSIHLTR